MISEDHVTLKSNDTKNSAAHHRNKLHSFFVYLCISIISRSPEMLYFLVLSQIICLFLLFPDVQKCYVFRQDRFISVVSFWNGHHNVLNKYKHFFASSVTQVYIKIYGRSNYLGMSRVGYFRITVSWYHRYDGHNCIVVASTPESCAIILASLKVSSFLVFWKWPP